jgi:hypothetical protein
MSSKILVIILISLSVSSLYAQKGSIKEEKEITAALELWNKTSGEAKIDQMMSLFDNSDNIMGIGSANGEIFKGRDQIRNWLTQLYGFAGFSWEMNRVDIDSNGNTAWIFVDGSMVLKFHNGGTKKAPYRFSGILVKKKGVWKWRLFNGSVPQQE